MIQKEIKIELFIKGQMLNKTRIIRNVLELISSPHKDYILNLNDKSYKISDVYCLIITIENANLAYDIVISNNYKSSQEIINSSDLMRIILTLELNSNSWFIDNENLLLLIDKKDIEEI